MSRPVRIALIPGDGIGGEVMAEAAPCLDWAAAQGRCLEAVPLPYGAEHYLATGETLPEEAFRALRDGCDAVLFGAVGDPRIPDGRHAEQILLRLRQELELAVNFRPCRPLAPGFDTAINLEVYRENTEGPYCLQGTTEPGRAVDYAIHTEPAVHRLLTCAFQRAAKQGRPLLLAHKANVLKHGHGLWLRVFAELRTQFPAVDARTLHADALLCALVQDPKAFGIIAADNYLGDLISDLTAAYVGGMGMAPSGDIGDHHGLFQPAHGTAPDIADKGIANPTAMILSVAMMLEWLSDRHDDPRLQDGALAIQRAVEISFANNIVRPAEFGGKSNTAEITQAIIANL